MHLAFVAHLLEPVAICLKYAGRLISFMQLRGDNMLQDIYYFIYLCLYDLVYLEWRITGALFTDLGIV